MVAAAPAKAETVSVSTGQEAGQDDFMTQKLNDLIAAKEALTKKNSEISMMRKESEWMKRELRNRDEEIKAMRSMKVYANSAPKKKPVQATRTR